MGDELICADRVALGFRPPTSIPLDRIALQISVPLARLPIFSRYSAAAARMRDAFEFVYDQFPRRELTGASGEVSRSEDKVLGDKSELGIGSERIVLSAGSGHEIGSTVTGNSAVGAYSAIMRRTASSRLKSGLERSRASSRYCSSSESNNRD